MACPKCCTTWNVYWQATIFSVILALYLIVGGAIFVALERPAESQRAADAERQIQIANETILRTILNISNVTEAMAQNVTNNFLTLMSQLAPQIVAVNKARTPLWQLGPAIFFTTTVVTTIGYGNIAPSTPGGQTFLVFYAIVGIPLALVLFSSVGTVLSNALGSLVSRIKTKHPLPLKIAVVVGAIATGFVLFLVVPALIFMAIEGWTYRQSAYYCFVSLSTIGFGDFVPGQSTSIDMPVGVRGVYKICTACWLVFGIAFLSLLIAEVQKLFTSSAAAMSKLRKKKTEDAKESGEEAGGKQDGSAGIDVPTITATETKTELPTAAELNETSPGRRDEDRGAPKEKTSSAVETGISENEARTQ